MNKARFTASSAIILGDPEIGEGTWIGYFTILDGKGDKLTIGKNCSIASGVHIYTHSTHKQTTEAGEYLHAPVVIGDNVAVGANSIIMHGSVIENHVCVPALTVVKPFSHLVKNILNI